MTQPPPGAGPVDAITAGTLVREWRVVRFIGRGAYGQVFEAVRSSWLGDDGARALKVFDPILSSAARGALLGEFDALRHAHHPHLLRGEDAFDIDDGPLRGCVVFVLERADTDLAAEIDRRGPLPVTEVATIGAQVASGLAALHATGRLHGDVKPANLLRAAHDWKLGDFGVTGTLVGSYAVAPGATLDFLPPELSTVDGGARLHRSADVWALGVTLWMAATGQHPFIGGESHVRYASVLRGDRRPAPGIDPALAALLDHACLVEDPRARSSPEDLVAPLAELARAPRPTFDATAQPAAVPVPAEGWSDQPTVPAGAQPAAATDRRSLRPGGAVAAAVVVAGAVTEACSLVAGGLGTGLGLRRAAYLGSSLLLLLAAWAVARGKGWLSGPSSLLAALAAGVVVVVATLVLFL